jgi:hypothetical protein
MEWVPVVFIAFKVGVLSIGMFFAVKWHYDRGRTEQGAQTQRALLLAGGKVAAVFVLLLVGLLLLTFALATALGLDLTLP